MATVSIDVVVVLPWVPAIASPVRPAITEASAAARGSTRRPSARAASQLGVARPDRAGDDHGVGRVATCDGSCPTSTVAPSARERRQHAWTPWRRSR